MRFLSNWSIEHKKIIYNVLFIQDQNLLIMGQLSKIRYNIWMFYKSVRTINNHYKWLIVKIKMTVKHHLFSLNIKYRNLHYFNSISKDKNPGMIFIFETFKV